ncbi:hypothetical protein [Rothia sp. P5766]|uniref:hypothetical protein n=2 Tax=unclassified Rothia (in: high G+C Gram-positive bacteria) TaxID=2689056 RepID=UPI003AE23D36
MEDSKYYTKVSLQETIDEWMLARNGTIKASGDQPFYYDGEDRFAVDPESTDMRYDLPGNYCPGTVISDPETHSAYASLNVSTKAFDSSGMDVEVEIERVSEFWRSQGWTDIRRGPEATGERRIYVYSPSGLRLIYEVMISGDRAMKSLQMDSMCAREFASGSPVYLGDFEDRYFASPSASSSEGQ